MGERLQGDDHQQKDQGQADQQNIQRDFVRVCSRFTLVATEKRRPLL
ncbi:Unknown protein sequence [Pseudomonas amygdali pv. morsprunorum]|nr:Unknown protein sequence [Pseudomonas amygdali pv. morsprunorum]